MKMKKLLSLTLVTAMVATMSLVGCGSKEEAPAETPEETSEHSEESEKAPADADVSSEEPVKTETVRADAPVSEDGESSSEKEDSDAAPDDSTTVTVEEITE